MIVDCLKNENYGDSSNLGGITFNLTVHVSKTEMI